MYSISHNGKEISPKKGSRWLWSKEKFEKAYANNEIVINESKSGFSVRFKQYLKDENGKIRNGKPLSIKADVFNQEGTREVADLLGKRGIFDFPKPVKLIEYLFSFIINDNDDDKDGLYLDFFAGSASSAHAVMKLNSEDGGNRRYIMVQFPEPCGSDSEAYKSGYNNICEIGKERIKRAGQKIIEEKNNALKNIDIGFKVFKLDETNLKVWDQESMNLEKELLDFVEPVKEGRTQEDVVYEILLKYGIDLTVPIEETTIAEKAVYSVGMGYLLICLERDLTLEQIEEMAKQQPERIVFYDEGFENDTVRTNAQQILKRYGVEDIRVI